MPAIDLDLLCDAAREASGIALAHWRNDPETWDKPDQAGPVSEADLAVDGFLKRELCGARPDYGWLSEETPDTDARLDKDKVFVVDPIDGTRAFLAGEKTWALSLAVVSGGQPCAGVVYLPAKELMYVATPDCALLNGTPIDVSSRDEIEDASVLATRPNFSAENWRLGTPPPVARHFRPSLAYRMALVAEGRFDAMLTLRPAWEWDIAAGSLIAGAAGARVTDQLGAPLRFNNPRPQVPGVLAGTPTIHDEILQNLAAADRAAAPQ